MLELPFQHPAQAHATSSMNRLPYESIPKLIREVQVIEQIEAINALAQYGNKAISSITKVIESSEHEKVKILGYKAIQKIKTHPLG